MSERHEPVRLRAAHSGADPTLRRLLEITSKAGPSAAHKLVLDEAILRRIAEQVQLDHDAGDAPNQPRKLWFGSRTWAKLLVIGIAATAGLGIASRSQRSEPAGSATASGPRAPSSLPLDAAAHSSPRAPSAAATVSAPRAEHTRASGSAPAAPQPSAAHASPRSQRALGIVRGAPKTPAPAAQSAKAGRADGVATSAHASPHESSPAPTQTSVPSELELLGRAQRALRTAPTHAIELTELHARAYPAGAFVEEREAIHIEALIAAGQASLARERGHAFLTRYKRSAYASQVRRLLQRTP